MKKSRSLPISKSDRAAGDLQRNNVYTTAAVQDWAGRIRSGPGGLRMNEKFMLVTMSTSCNPRGVCELPVRYLADYIGVGMRQAQRIIAKLNEYELIQFLDVAPQGRPNDIVRKFLLRTIIDPDTWNPKDGTTLPLMRHIREEFTRRIKEALLSQKINDIDFLHLSQVHLVVVRSKQLDFVSPDSAVTDTVYRYKAFLLKLVSALTKAEVLRLHMIPKKGYRG